MDAITRCEVGLVRTLIAIYYFINDLKLSEREKRREGFDLGEDTQMMTERERRRWISSILFTFVKVHSLLWDT